MGLFLGTQPISIGCDSHKNLVVTGSLFLPSNQKFRDWFPISGKPGSAIQSIVEQCRSSSQAPVLSDLKVAEGTEG
jgi:hypothetical protein